MCECFARCEADCVCDHDWTPPELTAARERIAVLEAERDQLRAAAEERITERNELVDALRDTQNQLLESHRAYAVLRGKYEKKSRALHVVQSFITPSDESKADALWRLGRMLNGALAALKENNE